MNCYFICQKVSKFPKTCFTTTKETALAPFNLAHPIYQRVTDRRTYRQTRRLSL